MKPDWLELDYEELPPWLHEQLMAVAMLRAINRISGRQGLGRDSLWPSYMKITREELTVELPFTPPCRHLEPHEPRPCETHEELVFYLVFKQLGWEEAGYCWSYVPGFLHEWFGCGPGQEHFVRASA